MDDDFLAILSQVNISEDYVVYENGTICLVLSDNDEVDEQVILRSKKKMGKFNLFYSETNPNTMFVSKKIHKCPAAQELMRKDLEERILVFDSREDSLLDLNVTEYIIYNSDLNMSKGKLMAQACHAQHKVTCFCLENPTTAYKSWDKGHMKKVCLRATEKQMRDLAQKPDAIPIYDAGTTEIPAGSLTVVAFPPMFQKDVPVYLTSL